MLLYFYLLYLSDVTNNCHNLISIFKDSAFDKQKLELGLELEYYVISCVIFIIVFENEVKKIFFDCWIYLKRVLDFVLSFKFQEELLKPYCETLIEVFFRIWNIKNLFQLGVDKREFL